MPERTTEEELDELDSNNTEPLTEESGNQEREESETDAAIEHLLTTIEQLERTVAELREELGRVRVDVEQHESKWQHKPRPAEKPSSERHTEHAPKSDHWYYRRIG